MDHIPLSHEASAGDCNKQTTSTLPPEVDNCLVNARFLHLATCTNNTPHVSLMNYTYLPPNTSPYSLEPLIIMTTNPSSKKWTNLSSNPAVSLLVHDWVSHRPPTSAGRRLSGGSPGPEHRSSLASLLLNLNTSAVSSISATISGEARLVAPGTEEEKFYREAHLENNTFEGEEGPSFGGRRESVVPAAAAERRESNQQDDEGVRVIVVAIRNVRISDWKGGVSDYVLVPDGGNGARVNGI
ncbi:hypothetical protein GE09DRAFT_1030766 [Coniochaeta sp. 2T2.1]|nr:hypothetical protein GE09DRAFT_1030766 [Coniochaeta sp. 2T2.1]